MPPSSKLEQFRFVKNIYFCNALKSRRLVSDKSIHSRYLSIVSILATFVSYWLQSTYSLDPMKSYQPFHSSSHGALPLPVPKRRRSSSPISAEPITLDTPTNGSASVDDAPNFVVTTPERGTVEVIELDSVDIETLPSRNDNNRYSSQPVEVVVIDDDSDTEEVQLDKCSSRRSEHKDNADRTKSSHIPYTNESFRCSLIRKRAPASEPCSFHSVAGQVRPPYAPLQIAPHPSTGSDTQAVPLSPIVNKPPIFSQPNEERFPRGTDLSKKSDLPSTSRATPSYAAAMHSSVLENVHEQGSDLAHADNEIIEIHDSDDEAQLTRNQSRTTGSNNLPTIDSSQAKTTVSHYPPVQLSYYSASCSTFMPLEGINNFRLNRLEPGASSLDQTRMQSNIPIFPPEPFMPRLTVPHRAPLISSLTASTPTGAVTPGVRLPSTVSVVPKADESRGALSEDDFLALVKQNELLADAEMEAPTPPEMTLELMPHQRRALEWMSKREKSLNIDEVIATDDECLGGILADEQGLGKTLTMIAVMLRNKPIVESFNGTSTVNGRPLSDGESESDGLDRSSFQQLNQRSLRWRTLVVCPLSLLEQWRTEILSNIRLDSHPSVCIYHGQKRDREGLRLKQYDVVITTYATLVSDFPKVRNDLYENKLRKQANLELLRRPPGPLFCVHWRRVVLDEAHNIKNRRTDSYAAATFLKADMRWCLTGTPITNSVDDIYSLFCFIRYRFVPNYETWNHRWKKRLEHPWENVRSLAFKQFQTLCGVVVLRRTKKDTINGLPVVILPKKHLKVLVKGFRDKDEILTYKSIEEQSVRILNKYLNSSYTGLYSSMFVLLLRLRQACCHPFLVQYSQMHGNGSRTKNERYSTPYRDDILDQALELLEGGQSMLDLFDEGVRERLERVLHPPVNNGTRATVWHGFTCNGCSKEQEWKQGSFFGCGDLFCKECVLTIKRQMRCIRCGLNFRPGDLELCANDVRIEVHAKVVMGTSEGLTVCRREAQQWVKEEISRRKSIGIEDHSSNVASPSSLNAVRTDDDRTASLSDQREQFLRSFSQTSTKIESILQELEKTRQNGRNEKTLIFSQWTSMLDIVEFHLELNGYETCRLDGGLNRAERDKQIEKFKNNITKRVLLMSLHAGGTGLNLTVASRVILCDVWWNPSVEEQAIDRVHRIGQTQAVYVTRFRMENTVEDRIYTICNSKREKVFGALGESSAQSSGRRKQTMTELLSLFNGIVEGVANRAENGSEIATAAANILNNDRLSRIQPHGS